MTSNPPDSSKPAKPAKPLWRRLFGAQESGLVIVIALVMAALTVFGGTKPGNIERIALSSAVTAVDGSGDVLTLTADAFTRDQLIKAYGVSESGPLAVKVGDQTTRINVGTNPRVTGDDADRQLLVRRTINKFLDINNIVLIAKNASFIAIMAVGMTAIIIMGGIDLSVGSIYALAAVIGAISLRKVFADSPESGTIHSLLTGVIVCGGLGAICGAFNGIMIVGLRVHPFIITLGTMAIFRGLVFMLTKGESISDFSPHFTKGFFKAEIGSGLYPVPIFVMALVVAVGVFVLSRTVLGRRAYAIGGNETAAVYAGVPVGRVKIIFYTLCGMLAGLSACVYLGYLGAAEPGAGQGYELSVVAATVIGGASLSGGRGSAAGAMLGAILVELINNAMVILEIDQSYTQIVMGTAIIAAVVVDQAKGQLTVRGK